MVNRILLTASCSLAVACFHDPEELACERAITHISECCWTLSAPDVCTVEEPSMLFPESSQAIVTEAEASCILRRSCDQLQAACMWAEALDDLDTGTLEVHREGLVEALPGCVQ